MSRKSKEQLKYELSSPIDKIVINLEKLNTNIDRLITTNITVNRDQEKILRFIANRQINLVELQNKTSRWTDTYIKSLKEQLAGL